MKRRSTIALLLWLIEITRVFAASPDYLRDVRPILVRSCFGCHGPDKQKSGYRLDVREIALRGGEHGVAAVVPHRAADSPLVRFVSGLDKQWVMPPLDSEVPKLSAAEIDILRAWVDAGPQWPDEWAGSVPDTKTHWSLAPLVKPSIPYSDSRKVKQNPIDAFVGAKRIEKKLMPSPAADRRTLLRRLSYDLTGLPPTFDEVEAFVASTDDGAYEKWVDRWLASPRHGEHWTRHWLDAAHYADTHGNDHDYARWNAWPYRDYVIRSFNEDKSYARFVQEQIAGDALFPDDPQATVALGFLAAGPWDETLMVGVREDTFDHRLAQVLDRDDMVTTVMSTFQGLTVHCARCHNHKFDPITQREYYALQAVFAGVDRADRPYDSDPAVHLRRRTLLARKSGLVNRDPAVLKPLAGTQGMEKVKEAIRHQSLRTAGWEVLDVRSVVSASGAGTRFERQADGSWYVRGERPEKDTFLITGQSRVKDIGALRLEALPDDRLPGRGPGRYEPSGNFHLTEFRAEVQPAIGVMTGAEKIEFARATADHSDAADLVKNALDGRKETYWSVHPRYGEAHEAVFELKSPVGDDVGTTWMLRLEFDGKPGHQLGRFRISFCTGTLPVVQRDPLPLAITDLLKRGDVLSKPEAALEAAVQLATLEVDRELAELPASKWVYAVTHDFSPKGSFKPAMDPRPIHLLQRGELNKPGEKIEPGSLACLSGLPGELRIATTRDESARRAALALWLTEERNVLLWRVMVNRVWSLHFGRGLCDTPNDFGKMGGKPTHPELLDWLAVWFRDEARGSLKALHRLIVLSETYQQSVTHRETAASVDTDNRLLWRMNRQRLTAEQVRDSLLQFSGGLDLTMGGPAVVQFADRGAATFMPDGGAPAFIDYESFSVDAPQNRRRSIYRFLFRTLPDPFMEALDAPDGGALVPVRNQSTTAPQAFALLNNGFVIRQCEHIADRLRREGAADDPIPRAFRLILQRNPTVPERERFAVYARAHGLANAVQILINSNEFFYLD